MMGEITTQTFGWIPNREESRRRNGKRSRHGM